MLKYWFGFTTTLLESLRSQNTQFRDGFRQTCYKDLVFAQGKLLSILGAQNESLRIMLMYYIFKYLFGITTTLLDSLRSQNTQFRARFRHTNYKDLVFARGEFLSVVGAQNESPRIILMYYMFKYWFGITTTLLESLRSQNTQFGARFRHTNYKDLVFARAEFLSVVGAQNESLRIILMYFMFKYWFGITTTLLESLLSQNTQFRARFRQTSYKGLVFVRREFLSVVGAQNESLRLIIIYYIELHIWDLNNFARFTSEPKNKSKRSI